MKTLAYLSSVTTGRQAASLLLKRSSSSTAPGLGDNYLTKGDGGPTYSVLVLSYFFHCLWPKLASPGSKGGFRIGLAQRIPHQGVTGFLAVSRYHTAGFSPYLTQVT